jgi:hypothetical protein
VPAACSDSQDRPPPPSLGYQLSRHGDGGALNITIPAAFARLLAGAHQLPFELPCDLYVNQQCAFKGALLKITLNHANGAFNLAGLLPAISTFKKLRNLPITLDTIVEVAGVFRVRWPAAGHLLLGTWS